MEVKGRLAKVDVTDGGASRHWLITEHLIDSEIIRIKGSNVAKDIWHSEHFDSLKIGEGNDEVIKIEVYWTIALPDNGKHRCWMWL